MPFYFTFNSFTPNMAHVHLKQVLLHPNYYFYIQSIRTKHSLNYSSAIISEFLLQIYHYCLILLISRIFIYCLQSFFFTYLKNFGEKFDCLKLLELLILNFCLLFPHYFNMNFKFHFCSNNHSFNIVNQQVFIQILGFQSVNLSLVNSYFINAN